MCEARLLLIVFIVIALVCDASQGHIPKDLTVHDLWVPYLLTHFSPEHKGKISVDTHFLD